jgi:hypothetical protein
MGPLFRSVFTPDAFAKLNNPFGAGSRHRSGGLF